MAEEWLTGEVIDAVAAHMNRDHADDNVVICQIVGDVPDAVAATMVGMDHAGLDFDVTTPEGVTRARVAFSAPVTERGQIRAEVARIYQDAVESARP